MSFEERLIDDSEMLERRDESRLLWNLATAGAQVRRAVSLAEEFGVDRLRGELPRALLVATDTPPSAALRLITRLSCESTPALAWHGVELPRWAGPSDALLIGALDGRHPRLAELAEQGARRGMAMAVVAPRSPVAAAAGRSPVHELPEDLNPYAARWAVLAPLLQALDALGLQSVPAELLERVADTLDATAEMCRPTGEVFTNPAKALAVQLAEARPLIVGAGALASVAARSTADALQLSAGSAAVAVSLPDGVGRAGALLRGTGAKGVGDDFFRDRVEDIAAQRTHLLVIGDDGEAGDASLGDRSGAQIQLDEVAARRAAAALRRLAEDLGAGVSNVEVPDGPPLARFAAAAAFGEFTAAYLAFGLGLDPGATRPADLGH